MAGPPHHPEIEFIARGVLWHERRVLLCRNVKSGYFYLPGGHVDFDESAAQACAREFLEETGLVVAAGDCRLVAEVRFSDAHARRHHELNLVFHVEHNGATPLSDVTSQEPQIDFVWAEHAQIVDLDLRPAVIKAWLAGDGTEGPADSPIWVSSAE